MYGVYEVDQDNNILLNKCIAIVTGLPAAEYMVQQETASGRPCDYIRILETEAPKKGVIYE